MTLFRQSCMLLCAVVASASVSATSADEPPSSVTSLLQAQCYDCHQGTGAEAGLDLSALSADLGDPDVAGKWTRIFDRVESGEMPPSDVEPLAAQPRKQFLSGLSTWIQQVQQSENDEFGRVRSRRLTNLQLERSLHDLLGVDIPLANQMPEEPRTGGFTTVAQGQAMSHFQLQQHVAVVDAALDEAFRRALTSPDERERHLSADSIARRRKRSRTREPELIDDHAVVWSGNVIFYGRLPATTAREEGWRRFTIRAKGLNCPDDGGVWCTVRSGRCVSSAPLLAWVGAFEATNEPKEMTFDAWMPAGHMLELRPGDATLKRARFAGGQVGTGDGAPQDVPGVAIEWIKVERIHYGADDEKVRRLLFGDAKVETADRQDRAKVASDRPQEDIASLMRQFARRAFRRPVDDEMVKPYVELALASLDRNDDFAKAVRVGYRALLCSPRFLYFYEQPGRLDDFALASRLSYFLWNRMPDEELFSLADASKLSEPKVFHAQVERMLDDPKGRKFIKDLAGEWLDMRLIDFTEPDRRLYPGFDPIVEQSMVDETHAFLQKMLQDDLNVSLLIDSDFTFLNSRLANYYDIDGVEGDELTQVKLRENDNRGGLLTHGSILKITANGTTTSPVIRGVWVSERLLGREIPPPPENIPAIEPDIRGAKTIREMLAKHKSDASCASCHVAIDPPGFALENYDPSGRWREKYGARRGRRGRGAPVDASYETADGRPFDNIDGFKSLILDDPQTVARNVVEKLLTYGTGAPIAFADRQAVAKIVDGAAESDYGFRTLVHGVAASSVFQSK